MRGISTISLSPLRIGGAALPNISSPPTLEFIADNGGRQVFLEVAVANVAAHALYRQFGFRICRLRKNYYGFGQDAYVLRLSEAGCPR